MDNVLVLKTKVDTKNFDKQIEQLKDKIEDLEGQLEVFAPNTKEFQDINVELEKARNKLTGLYAQQNKINSQGFNKAQQAIEGIGHSAEKVGKSILRWGLALIGVRSAMTLIRGSMSILSQYDDQLAKDMEYIRYVLAMMLKPLIEYLISLIFTLLQYINYIAMAWFNVNLFANASAKSMEKTTKNAEKAQKAMAKMNKDLFGFDKINKLTSQGTSTGGGTGASTLPSIDLSKALPQGQVPEWLRWITEHKDLILEALAGIATGLLAIKLGFSGIQGLGFAMVLIGVIELVQDLSKYLGKLDSSLKNNGTKWEDLGKIFIDIGGILIGVALIIGSLPLALAGAIAIMLGTVLYFYDTITTEIENIKTDIDTSIRDVEGKFGGLLNGLTGIFSEIGYLLEDCFVGTFKPIKDFVDGVLLLFKGDFGGGLTNIFKGITNIFIGSLNKMVDGINIIITPLRALIKTIGDVSAFFQGKAPPSMADIRLPHISYWASTGAIINFPGRGVPITGNVRGGERGAEGVIPLTDNTTMERLGESIGKHVKVNLDLTTEIEGRVLARVLRQINNEDSFARNGG